MLCFALLCFAKVTLMLELKVHELTLSRGHVILFFFLCFALLCFAKIALMLELKAQKLIELGPGDERWGFVCLCSYMTEAYSSTNIFFYVTFNFH